MPFNIFLTLYFVNSFCFYISDRVVAIFYVLLLCISTVFLKSAAMFIEVNPNRKTSKK